MIQVHPKNQKYRFWVICYPLYLGVFKTNQTLPEWPQQSGPMTEFPSTYIDKHSKTYKTFLDSR